MKHLNDLLVSIQLPIAPFFFFLPRKTFFLLIYVKIAKKSEVKIKMVGNYEDFMEKKGKTDFCCRFCIFLVMSSDAAVVFFSLFLFN